MTPPVAPSPLEQVPPDEAAAIADLVALQSRLGVPARPRRGQHAKGHGLVSGTFTVRADVPPPLRVGLFAAPNSFACWVRFSNGFAEDDRLPDVHGIGIKLLAPPAADHDFLLVDHETFFAADVRRTVGVFSRHVELLAFGVSPAEHDRLLAAEYPVEAVLLGGFVCPADPSPLEPRYFSGTPYALGDRAVKYQLVPRSENLAVQRTSPDTPDFLRAALAAHLSARSATFDFCVQPQRDPVSDPVEDPTVAWGGDAVPVAVLTLPVQEFDTAEREALADALAFSLWHAPAEHRPLGGINRGRKAVYEMSATARRSK